jgi:hypothetical protein
VLPSDFRTAMPAFAGVSDDDINRWLGRSTPYFDVGRWGSFLSDGLANWVAHQLLVENTAAALPNLPVVRSLAIGKKVGTESVAYSDKMIQEVAKNPYKATGPGCEYYRLAVTQVGRGGTSA